MKRILQYALTILICFFCLSCFSKRTELEHFQSPNGQTEVVLERFQSSDVTSIGLMTRTGEKTFNLQTPLYYEIDRDGDKSPDFEKVFHVKEWINNNIFFVGYNDKYKISDDFIFLTNSSSNSIDQIRIDAGSIYVIYNIQPNETVKIPIDWEQGQIPSAKCYTSVEVDFSDGTKILPGSNGFRFVQPDSLEPICMNGHIVLENNEVKYQILQNGAAIEGLDH